MKAKDKSMKKVILFLMMFMLATPAFASKKKTDDKDVDVYKYLAIFSETLKKIKTDYVEEVSEKKLIESAINGMLTALDPHSSYLNEDDFKEMQEQTKGEFGGLGIEVTMDAGFVKVVSPIDDTPAFKAGIQAGDYITHIEGKNVFGMTLNQAVEKMRGPLKTKVKLTIHRQNTEPFEVTITRDNIKIKSVKTEDKGNVGYLRISSFSETTTDDLKKTIDQIKKDHTDLVGYVLDLRNNPGGLLDQAVRVSDLFLTQGEIVSTRPRNKDEIQKFSAEDTEKGDYIDGLPLVVLINEGSASASEIVSGALQDNKRAVIVGMKSFGKGSVQTVVPVSDVGAIRLTTARYYTPSGRSIQAKGIEPDIKIPLAKVEYIQSHMGDFEEAAYENALDKQDEDKKDKKKEVKDEKKKKTLKTNKSNKDKEKEPDPFDKKDDKKEDYQLERAMDIVRALNILHQAGK